MQNVLAVSALLLAARPCAAADAAEWGQTVDGLRMFVAVMSDSRSDPQVRVTVNYVGDKPLLIPFAFISDTRIASYRLRLFLSASDGQHSFDLVSSGQTRSACHPYGSASQLRSGVADHRLAYRPGRCRAFGSVD